MERNEFIKTMIDSFEKNGYGDIINENSASKLFDLYEYLIEVNKVTNLTAITDAKEVILKHFLDCATICRYLPENARMLDVGCGAGFPSLPVAILREDIEVVSLDSTNKKIEFVRSAAEKVGITNLTAVCGRAEEYIEGNRESFDVCTSRAVARLNVLIEICAPYVKVGGIFVAMKSNKWHEELEEVVKSSKMLGFNKYTANEIKLSDFDSDIERAIIVFDKITETNIKYPRKYAQILKKPL